MWYKKAYSKYGNIQKIYKGEVYASKKEASFAQNLDLLQKARKIKSWKRQVVLPITVNKYHICNYIADFLLTLPDGTLEIKEVKGMRTAIFNLKWKLAQALFNKKYKFTLVT